MSTMALGKVSEPGESSGSPTAPSTISKDVLKEVLKEVLTENPSLLATAGRQLDDDAGQGKENSSCLACLCVLARGK